MRTYTRRTINSEEADTVKKAKTYKNKDKVVSVPSARWMRYGSTNSHNFGSDSDLKIVVVRDPS